MSDSQDLQQPLKIGEELTQYKIIKVLGRGGFGITYLAVDLNLDRQVVIKEFFPKEQVMRSSGSKVQPLSSGNNNSVYHNSLKKFLTEGRTLAKFRHNNIAQVLTAFPENNTAYLVMEYNKGEDLAQFIKKRNKPLDFTQIKKIFLPICKGLQALHKKDLLHLDIKPDNIYLPDKSEPYLIDFGGVRQFIASKDVSASFMVLTPGYAPAEQHSDTSKLGFYSDIYALGMTLYYALTLEKKLPQSTDRQQSLFEGDDDPLPLLTESVIVKNYPKDFITLVEQSIQPNRKYRLQNLDDLITILEGKKIKKKLAANKTKRQTTKTGLPIKKSTIGLSALIILGLGIWQFNAYQIEQQRQAEIEAEQQRQAEIEAEQQRQAEIEAEQQRQAEIKTEEQHPLPVEQAFPYSVIVVDANTLRATWKIHPEYYLYHDQFFFDVEHAKLGKIKFPKGGIKEDLFFGKVETHTGLLEIDIPLYDIKKTWQKTSPSNVQGDTYGLYKRISFTTRYQGCWAGDVCYPPVEKTTHILLPESKTIESDLRTEEQRQADLKAEQRQAEIRAEEQRQADLKAEQQRAEIKVKQQEQACNMGDAEACNDIAFLHHIGKEDGFPENLEKAKKYYKKGCDLGDFDSCNNVRSMDLLIRIRDL